MSWSLKKKPGFPPGFFCCERCDPRSIFLFLRSVLLRPVVSLAGVVVFVVLAFLMSAWRRHRIRIMRIRVMALRSFRYLLRRCVWQGGHEDSPLLGSWR